MITKDLTKSLERVSKQNDVARDSEYYLSKIGDIKSIDEFMSDTRLYNYALKAHGLEDMAYAKAFIRKVLTEGVDNDDAFANKLTDGRYKDLVNSLNFAAHGSAATSFTAAQKGVVDKYTRQTLEEEAGQDNAGVRLALYFERNAAKITSGYSILADDALAQVVRTTLGLAPESAFQDVDKQAAYLNRAIDVADFQDPKKVSKFLQRFTAMWEMDNPSDGYSPASLLGASSGYGISSDLLLSLNALKLGGK